MLAVSFTLSSRTFISSREFPPPPAETFEYRLGSRSALEWVIDQYQVKGESYPNREDDPHYSVLLVAQVVRASVETVRIVKSLPNLF